MFMRYGDFCDLFSLEQNAETFRFWLLSHKLTPNTIRAAIDKATRDNALRFWRV